MKKTIAVLLSVLMCSLLVVSAFAGQYKYEGKGFSFESDLAMDNFGGDVGDYIYESDYGSDKAPDYYYYEIEPQGDLELEIEIEAYCGRFDGGGSHAVEPGENDALLAKGPQDYYKAIETIAADNGVDIIKIAGCPAVIIEDIADSFTCYVCNDQYLYYINIFWFGEEPASAEFTQAVKDVKNIKFSSPCSYKFGGETEAANNTANTEADTNANANTTGTVETTDTPAQSNAPTSALIAIIAVAGVAVVVLAVVCIVLVTKKKK